ncbi:MAG: hypothetical protein LBJ73_00205 [Rickettsiales bacterium]|nr:hypothetical protein [Rickettsiales bacterium]
MKITEQQYERACEIFRELCAYIDAKKAVWFKQFGKEMLDDQIPYDTFLAIDDAFRIMMLYQKQRVKEK